MTVLITAAVLLELTTSGGISGKGNGRTTIKSDYSAVYETVDGQKCRRKMTVDEGRVSAPSSLTRGQTLGEQNLSHHIRMSSFSPCGIAAVASPVSRDGPITSSTAVPCRSVF